MTEENVQRLESQNEIETMGLREDFAYGVDDDADIGFYAMDEEGIRLSKIELEEGHFPREGKEIALSRGLLAEYGLEAGQEKSSIPICFMIKVFVTGLFAFI